MKDTIFGIIFSIAATSLLILTLYLTGIISPNPPKEAPEPQPTPSKLILQLQAIERESHTH